MTPETPLTEVAQHLPAHLADILLRESSDVQTPVLMQVRGIIVTMEAEGTVLNTFDFSAVMSGVVPTLIVVNRELCRVKDVAYAAHTMLGHLDG